MLNIRVFIRERAELFITAFYDLSPGIIILPFSLSFGKRNRICSYLLLTQQITSIPVAFSKPCESEGEFSFTYDTSTYYF